MDMAVLSAIMAVSGIGVLSLRSCQHEAADTDVGGRPLVCGVCLEVGEYPKLLAWCRVWLCDVVDDLAACRVVVESDDQPHIGRADVGPFF